MARNKKAMSYQEKEDRRIQRQSTFVMVLMCLIMIVGGILLAQLGDGDEEPAADSGIVSVADTVVSDSAVSFSDVQ